MGLSDREFEQLWEFAENSLNDADKRWSVASRLLIKDAKREVQAFREKAMATPFPGVPVVADETPEVRSYFVLMADMRDSTQHLTGDIPSSANVENGMHRVYLETSGLLPTIAYHVRRRKGKVTEYLGDGVLAFIEAVDLTEVKEFSMAHRVGEECLDICNEIVSVLLSDRYNLPAIEIGVGVSVGQAVVTIMGSGDDARPIAFGTPIFEASKMSKKRNAVVLSKAMRRQWPQGTSGKRQFKEVTVRGNDVGFRTWMP